MSDTLAEMIQRIGSPEVLVVGDLLLDGYTWGEVDRISPEAPVQVLKVVSEEFRPGGAGRVIGALSCLGAKVRCCSAVGADHHGEILKGRLEGLGADTSGIFEYRDRPTTVKTRMIAHSQQVLRLDREERKPIPDTMEDEVLEYLRRTVSQSDVVLVSDYNQGFVSPRILRELFDLARSCDLKVIVDPARIEDYAKYRSAEAITPNRQEAELAAGVTIRTRDDLRTVGTKLLEELGLEHVVITLGDEGISLFSRGGREQFISARARSVYDVTGAGDTVLAVLGFVVAAGNSFEEAVAVANVAGGIEVGKIGAVPLTREEILRELADKHSLLLDKVKPLEELVPVVEELRRKKQRVVFTNGCFDVLHVGHIRFLQFAKSQGDALVVGLNTDASVRRIKGPDRPILTETERSVIIAALGDVDYVVLFDDPTPLRLIEAIKPDVLVKGGDWTRETVVGHEIVESYGGRVAIGPYVEGVSTSDILTRVLDRHDKP